MATTLLPYPKHATDYVEPFLTCAYPIFLDSNDCDRYDVITADPLRFFQTDAFDKLDPALDALPTENPYDLPFTIGAIGYLSYQQRVTSDSQLPLIYVGIYDWSIVIDHHEKKAYLTTHCNDAKKEYLMHLLNQKAQAFTHFKIEKPFASNFTQKNYQTAFEAIQQNIYDGNCYQVNLAQRFTSEYSGDPWLGYLKLRAKNKAPFSAFLKTAENQAILCTSPERFIKADHGIVETKPIKGTAKRSNNPQDDTSIANALLQSEKDRAENIMIVDLLRNDLSKSCVPGSVSVTKLCALESFTNVHHLVSTITATLSPSETPFTLLKNCFPGGSITGAPKVAAMKLIEKLEPNERSLYCGSIFYISAAQRMDSNIVIRTAICDNGKIHCYAGGGIVYDSECEKEYAECFAKIGNLLQILQE